MSGSAGPRRPGLARAEDSFVLAEHIPMDGAIAVADALAEAFANWDAQVDSGRVDDATIVTYRNVASTLGTYTQARQANLVCDLDSEVLWGWVNAPATGTRAAAHPSQNMRKLRRATANALFATWYLLGITEKNVAASLPKVAASQRYVKPLTPDEIQRLKDHADYDTRGSKYESGYSRTSACLALVLLGAQPGEVGAIRVSDVDELDRAVFLSGGGSRYRDRWVPVDDDWAWSVIVNRLAYLHRQHPNDSTVRLAYRPTDAANGDNFTKRSAATTMTLTKLMKAAGVWRSGETRVASITEAVASRVFLATGRVEAVATRLGMHSLDRAAHLVGYDWAADFDPDPRDQP